MTPVGPLRSGGVQRRVGGRLAGAAKTRNAETPVADGLVDGTGRREEEKVRGRDGEDHRGAHRGSSAARAWLARVDVRGVFVPRAPAAGAWMRSSEGIAGRVQGSLRRLRL